MAIIKSGTYVFVGSPSNPPTTENVAINFKMYYLTANDTYADTTSNATHIYIGIAFGGTLTLYPINESGDRGVPQVTYSGNANSWSCRGLDNEIYAATDTTKLRTIIVETDQTVDDNFYTWFTANTTYTSNKLSVDLTTLSGWANLAPGNHTIKIVAKGTGYRDSEKSAGVTVTKTAAAYTDCLTFTGESSEFTLTANYGSVWDGTLYYSTDHNTWNVWNGDEISSANKKLYLKGKGNTKFEWYSEYAEETYYMEFRLSAKAGCSGNIQTLLDWENPPTSIPTDDCYMKMFFGCTNLTTAPELPATTLTPWCYYRMFFGCTSLTTAPNLPATTLAGNCYDGMFFGCTKLKVNTSSGNKIFTCPSTIPSGAVNSMFESTGGTFKGTPTAGNTYYWTE